MEERYSRLYSQDGMLYAEGSPVIVSAGAVLADSITRKLLVQLKLKNISDKEITSLSAFVLPLDADGKEIGSAVEYSYKALKAGRDEYFGTNTAIVMPGAAVRSYKVRIGSVTFADGSSWQQSNEEYFAPLSAPKLLEAALGDEELSRQFKIKYGGDCNYMPSESGDLWFCTCGEINRSDESKCHKCRRVHAALSNISISSLRSETSKRITSEKKIEEEENIENGKKRSKLIKLLAILVPVIIILAVLLATLPGYYQNIKDAEDYENAVAQMENGQYDLALQTFERLGDYENSRELAEKEIPYRRALYIMDCAESGSTDGLVMLGMKRSELEENETVSTALYRKAGEMFTALGDYNDSAAQATAAEKAISDYYESLLADSYDEATALLNEKSFCKARDAFVALGSYKDSASMASECIYQKAEQLMALTDKYSMEGIYCSLSTETGKKSVFYIPQNIYIKLGSTISTDIRAVCAPDGVTINYENVPESGYLPFCDAVSSLYVSLGNYKDCAEKSSSAIAAGDYTDTFYTFIENGDLAGAFNWLNEFQGEFSDRDRWADYISLYLPFCGTWQFEAGDPTLVLSTLGIKNTPCNEIKTSVFLSEDGSARLCIYPDSGNTVNIEMQLNVTEKGIISFIVSPDNMNSFYLVLNNEGKINYSRYSNIPISDTHSAVYAK